MKKIGILGGLSPESTVYYYQYITHEYTKRSGDYNFPEILIYSVAFQNFVDWGHGGDWKAIEDDMVEKLNKKKSHRLASYLERVSFLFLCIR